MEFEKGRCYTRDEIHERVGGGVRGYLPHRDGKVVAGCFRTDVHPDAPDVVLPGSGPEIERWAEVFAAQRSAVPVFLRQGTATWRHVGEFRVDHRVLDTAAIEDQKRRTGRADISQVLHLVADDQPDARPGTVAGARSRSASEHGVRLSSVAWSATVGGVVGFCLGVVPRRATLGFLVGTSIGTVLGSLREALRLKR